MKKQLLLSILTAGLISSFIQAVDVQALIQAINNKDGNRFLNIFAGRVSSEWSEDECEWSEDECEWSEEEIEESSDSADEYLKALQSLIDSGVDLEAKLQIRDPFTGFNCECRPFDILLVLMALDDSLEEVKFLVDHGADINFRDTDGLTALGYAEINNNKEMIDFLIQRGAVL